MLRRRQASIVLGVLLSTAISCRNEDAPSSPLVVAKQNPARIASHGRFASTDDQFADIASQVPGFGGAFIGANGRTHIYMNSGGTPDLSRLTPLLPASMHGREVTVLRGRYDFRDLKRWKESSREILRIPGVVYTDADELLNRVRIGVRSDDVAGEVRSSLQAYGIPSDAVIIRRAQFTRRRQSLRARYDTMVGAIGIVVQDPVSHTEGDCTFGAVVEDSAGRRFGVTNSHCAGAFPGTFGVVNGATILQGARQIGTELSDPPLYTGWHPFGGTCPTSRRCRNSDAIAFTLTQPSALTQVANSPIGNNGRAYPNITLRWRSDNGIFPQDRGAVVGDSIETVQAFTGKQRGVVDATCVEENILDNLGNATDVTLMCQDYASGPSGRGGDSGSPVMWIEPGTGRRVITGLSWGGGDDPQTGAPYIVFSSWILVINDLGSDPPFDSSLLTYAAP